VDLDRDPPETTGAEIRESGDRTVDLLASELTSVDPGDAARRPCPATRAIERPAA
jgi:hypothetical protein